MLKVPCHHCDRRYPGCHDHCERFAEYHKQREEELARKKKESDWYKYEQANGWWRT